MAVLPESIFACMAQAGFCSFSALATCRFVRIGVPIAFAMQAERDIDVLQPAAVACERRLELLMSVAAALDHFHKFIPSPIGRIFQNSLPDESNVLTGPVFMGLYANFIKRLVIQCLVPSNTNI